MHSEQPATVAKILGADFELANAALGPSHESPRRVANRLLAEIVGFPKRQPRGTDLEFGRRFLDSCGSSWYIDSDHLEGNLPEHASAWDHPVILHAAGFAEAERARRIAETQLPAGTRLNLLANCSDGVKAWGSHLSVLVTRRCFEDICGRKPHYSAFLATHLVTSVLYTGQGLLGAANGRSACRFQLSQRADWFEKFFGEQTMFARPLVNLRDEAHADEHLARLHIIFFDMVLSPVANILKAGTTQLVLAMLESGWADVSLLLDDPLSAASEISRDLSLRREFRTAIRGRMTAVEIQQALADRAGEFVGSGAARGIVPDAEDILSLWLGTLDLLKRRETEALAQRCDAWLKFLVLDRQRGRRHLSWNAPELRVADSLFASLDPEHSLFFQAAGSGFVDQMPDSQTLDRFAFEPPDDTRAYFRAHVLRRFGDRVSSIDWSRITFHTPSPRHWWSFADILMRDPRRLHRGETESLFDNCSSLEELVAAIYDIAEDDTAATALRYKTTTASNVP